jgi:hypothetical protein
MSNHNNELTFVSDYSTVAVIGASLREARWKPGDNATMTLALIVPGSRLRWRKQLLPDVFPTTRRADLPSGFTIAKTL